MSPIQQMLLGVGAVATKTYVDDLFSTFLYKGAGSTNTITNNIDLTEGGLVWVKRRDGSYKHGLYDTVRGVHKRLSSDANTAEVTDTAGITGFTATGFTTGDANDVNGNNDTYSSWSFRKAKGFFDVVTYTGNGSARTIAHSLGCVPGCIIIKRTDATKDWCVYHRSIGNSEYLELNNNQAETGSTVRFNATDPTASVFSVGDNAQVNSSSGTYVAYLFAGGESTAATARSVVFGGDSSNHDDELHPPSSLIPSGRDSNKFCLETWFKVDATNDDGMIYGQYVSGNAGRMFLQLQNSSSPYNVRLFVAGSDAINVSSAIQADTWYHLAWTYDGTTHRMFINGELKGTIAGSSLAGDIVQSTPRIGGINETGFNFPGQLSNFRVVHDQAVYTAAFKPSVTPLTTTSQGVSGSNCKVLCCNNSNILNNDGALAALTNPDNGTITASTDSPFDDPAGFVFGEAEDQNVIKCGSYVGNGSATGPEINLGWEPQWVLIKNTTTAKPWCMHDMMRGFWNNGTSDDITLFPNLTNSDFAFGVGEFTSTGFKLRTSDTNWNKNDDKYIYMCIRRPDGYVGKPPELGTDVFAMDTGNESSTIPAFDSGFVVDMRIAKAYNDSSNWWLADRLRGRKHLFIQSTDAESTASFPKFDSNVGEGVSWSSDYQGWMWKRSNSFTTLAYKGNGVAGRQIAHDMNKTVEMMWLKNRSSGSYNWMCYHKGLNGGTSPEDYFLRLNTNGAEASSSTYLNSTAPTSTHITLGSINAINADGNDFIAMLFASVDGISKVGSYTGNATDSDTTSGTNTITFGFQPRMVIVKSYDSANTEWVILDTLRGWASGSNNTKRLRLNLTNAQNNEEIGYPTSTGMVLTGNGSGLTNNNGDNYIYYAHA